MNYTPKIILLLAGKAGSGKNKFVNAIRKLFVRPRRDSRNPKQSSQNPFLPRIPPHGTHGVWKGRNTLGSDIDQFVDAEIRLYAAREDRAQKLLDEVQERNFLHEFSRISWTCRHCGATADDLIFARQSQGPAIFEHVCPRYAQQVADRFFEYC